MAGKVVDGRMRSAQFEEKEYEYPLYSQLQRGKTQLWPPGQVLEAHLGFDGALMLRGMYLWRLYGLGRPLRGLSPFLFNWPDLPDSQRSRLPRFRANCFIQVKRCEVGTRLLKRLKPLGDKRPFFRFEISSDQQQTLEASARLLVKKALFIYAAPVFSQSAELFSHMHAGTLVQNSTFPDVLSLSGHSYWYYNEPGADGVVNQGFEPRSLPSLEQQLSRLLDLGRTDPEITPNAALADLRHRLEAAVFQNGDRPEARAAFLIEEWRQLDALAERVALPPQVTSFLAVDAFAAHFNLLWLTLD